MLKVYPEDPLSPPAVELYFKKRYHDEKRLDKLEILKDWEAGYARFCFRFRWWGENFRVIDDETESVIIPFGERARELLNDPLRNLRELQRYSVELRKKEVDELRGLLAPIAKGVWKLDVSDDPLRETYNGETGLKTDAKNAFLSD